MAWQQSDLDKIRQCIASGVMQVHYADGRRVIYQSLDHLVAAEKVIASALKAQTDLAQGIRRRKFASYRSGF